MKTIEIIMLENITGGATVGLTGTPAPTRRGTSSSAALTTAMSGITSALDSLKSSQNNTMNQLLPVVVMAKWMQNR